MKRVQVLQEIRKIQFEQVHTGWKKRRLTQFARAMAQLGMEMIPAYSPQARGRSERMFKTHQDRLVKELAMAGITDMAKANKYIKEIYMPNFNNEFAKPASENKSVFVPWAGEDIKDILCEQHKRTVNNSNCISFKNLTLQIPKDQYRCHYVKARVRVNLKIIKLILNLPLTWIQFLW